MKGIKLFLSLCTIVIAGSYTSCNKMEKGKDATAETAQLRAISAKTGFKDFPAVENGMLKFRNDGHYASYIAFLDKAIESYAADSTDTVNDENTVLQNIEDGLKFTSLRNVTHNAFLKQNEIGWATIEEIPDEHFITSADIRSTLNSSLDVQIGNNIIHYINKDYLVGVDAGQTDLLNKFRGLPITASIDDIMAVDVGQQYTAIQLLTKEGFIWDKRKRPDPVPLGDWNMMKPFIKFKEPCSNPHLATIRDIALYDGYQPAINAQFLINFGDGSAPVIKQAQPIGVPEFTHLFPAAGVYNVTITAYIPGSSTIATQRTDQATVLDGGCERLEKNSGWYYTIIGNKAVSGNIYIESFGFLGGSNRMRMIAKTRSMEYKNDAWRLVKGKIGLHSLCSIKDWSCNQFDVLEATDERSKSKEFSEHRSANGLFYWTTASCEHYIIINGTKYTLQVSMNSCN